MKKKNLFTNFIYFFYIFGFVSANLYILKINNFSFHDMISAHFNIFLISLLISILLIFLAAYINFKKNFIIYFSLSLFTIYAFEIYSYKYIYDYGLKSNLSKLRYNIAKKNNIKFDTRNKFDVFIDLKKKYENVSTSFRNTKYYREKLLKNILPFSGISKHKTLLCNENGYYSVYDSDRYGFNNPDTEWDKKTDIILVGDSFTHGYCVKENLDLGSLIRNNSDYSLLNLGWMGNGPLLEYASLIEYGFERKPKKIIWVFFESDLHNLKANINIKLLKKYLVGNFKQDLMNRDNEKNQKLKKIILEETTRAVEANKNNYIKNIIKLYNFRTIISKLMPEKLRLSNTKYQESPSEEVDSETLSLFEDIIKKAKVESDKKNIEFYFVYIPRYTSVKSKIFNSWNRNEVISIIKKNKIHLINMHDVLVKEKNFSSYYPFGLDGHFNNKGYKLLSNHILKAIN